MAEEQGKEKSIDDIKKDITDLFSFNFDDDFYKKDMKDELVEKFKEILNFDDPKVRKFVQNLFVKSLELAQESDMVKNETEEVEEEKPETEEVPEEETKEEPKEEPEEKSSDEEPEDKTKKESVWISRANNYLI